MIAVQAASLIRSNTTSKTGSVKAQDEGPYQFRSLSVVIGLTLGLVSRTVNARFSRGHAIPQI